MPIPMMNHRAVDLVHLELVNKLEAIKNLINEGKSVDAQLEQLFRITREHFEYEERLMTESSYPGIDPHKLVHDRILSIIETVILIPTKTVDRMGHHLDNLTEKLVEHVVQYDVAFFEFYNAQIHGDVV